MSSPRHAGLHGVDEVDEVDGRCVPAVTRGCTAWLRRRAGKSPHKSASLFGPTGLSQEVARTPIAACWGSLLTSGLNAEEPLPARVAVSARKEGRGSVQAWPERSRGHMASRRRTVGTRGQLVRGLCCPVASMRRSRSPPAWRVGPHRGPRRNPPYRGEEGARVGILPPATEGSAR